MSEKMTALEKAKARAEALATAAKAAKAKAAKLEARARATAVQAERAKDTKRKVLLGAYVLSQRQDIATSPDFLAWLTRPDDRALF